MTSAEAGKSVIEARDLKTHFKVGGGIFAALAGQEAKTARALDGVNLTIRSGEVVGLVG